MGGAAGVQLAHKHLTFAAEVHCFLLSPRTSRSKAAQRLFN
jgi:hypothetical protein